MTGDREHRLRLRIDQLIDERDRATARAEKAATTSKELRARIRSLERRLETCSRHRTELRQKLAQKSWINGNGKVEAW